MMGFANIYELSLTQPHKEREKEGTSSTSRRKVKEKKGQ